MRRIILLLLLFLGTTITVGAQEDSQPERQLISNPRSFFVPHWYVKAQGGAAYDIGEAKFYQLLSPSLQVSLGYKFNELIGVRGGLSGLWARNRYAYPEAKYQWNFIQPAIDAELDLTQLVLGKDPERLSSVYAFLGAGVAFSFNNDDAVEADKRYGIDFQKLWTNNRWNPVVRAGLGFDYRIADEIAIGAELNANMLPDHFNSKLGKKDNRDWHLNALVGIKFTIGKSHGRTEGLYETVKVPETVVQETVVEEFVDVPIEKISFNVNIQFLINQSIIRSNQIAKLNALLKYLNEHPKAFIRLSGFADKETGTPEINMRLSRERANVVSQYLQDAGIQEWRIRRFAKGDRVQPFDIPEDNRVCICFVYDPENPVPQAFEY
ncbi:MAG: OmpA family protein [Prevotella sp.]|nr:OmpA family protein [Prevotella sp.]